MTTGLFSNEPLDVFARVLAHTHAPLYSWVHESSKLSHRHIHRFVHKTCHGWLSYCNPKGFRVHTIIMDCICIQVGCNPNLNIAISSHVCANLLSWYLELMAHFSGPRRWNFKLHCTCRHHTMEIVVCLWFELMHSVCSCVFVYMLAVLMLSRGLCHCKIMPCHGEPDRTFLCVLSQDSTMGCCILRYYQRYLWSMVWARRRWSLHWGPAVTETLPS